MNSNDGKEKDVGMGLFSKTAEGCRIGSAKNHKN